METARAARGGRRQNLSLRHLAPLRARRDKQSIDRAFESFYRKHVAEVYQYALAVLTNPADAEDVTQQTFLNAYRAWQRGERPEVAHNWLIKIAHNVCRMRWRQAGRRPQEVPLENVREPVTIDEDRPDVENVLRALQTLPFNQRAALVMREVEGRTYNEIAEILGTTVPSVEALLFRARRRLQAKRKALGVLTTVPLPGSLSSFFGGGGAAAVGGAVVGADVALKAAAVVATGIVAGGVGFKAVKAVANSSPPPSVPKIHIAPAPLFAANPVKLIVDQRKKALARQAALSHPVNRTDVDRGGAGRSPTDDVIGSANGESSASGGATGGSGSGIPSAGTTVDSAVSQLPVKSPVSTPALPPAPPISLPPPPTLPVTVTVPTLPTLPPPPPHP
jgi:RNA polymerase sigma-70 factor (ECF subfamily)